MRLFIAVSFSILIILSCAAGQEKSAVGGKTESRTEKFDPARDAAADIQAAIKEAGLSHRRILLDVGGEWCIWCRRLDSLFAGHADLRDYEHAHFVVVKVNYSKENKNESVLSKYPKIPGYPHLFVLESDGTLLKSQDTGELESGKGHDPAKVMAFLKQWSK
jgi:thioredoxin-related protein